MAQGRYVVLVPVKSPGSGKSRLLGVPDRAGAAAAFAMDTVSAALATDGVAQVVVTTDDVAFAGRLADLGAVAVDDPGRGLNAALRYAADFAVARWPHLRPVALLADLPALRPADLAAALMRIGGRGPVASYVADADGTGTVLYSAPIDLFDSHFGADSARAHREAGAIPVPGGLASLRRDVDDLETLEAARALGFGSATAAQLGSFVTP